MRDGRLPSTSASIEPHNQCIVVNLPSQPVDQPVDHGDTGAGMTFRTIKLIAFECVVERSHGGVVAQVMQTWMKI